MRGPNAILVKSGLRGSTLRGARHSVQPPRFAWAFAPEKAMAPHSNTLAWKIPWTEDPGRLQSVGSLRVGHD